ncbi:unnamed protein product [Hydatigera taeniaeformis]|uniref:SAM-dependent methyltransferase n=1 Tax=Hydatigena taeniaeformis TaxID=6205 RepID=A0A0R3X4N4_HYDTA|nr:unnamed protein product [Hydatigera taeniaeformis]
MPTMEGLGGTGPDIRSGLLAADFGDGTGPVGLLMECAKATERQANLIILQKSAFDSIAHLRSQREHQ